MVKNFTYEGVVNIIFYRIQPFFGFQAVQYLLDLTIY